MLRLLRFRSNFLSLGARANPARPPQPEVIRIQRVKFRRKIIKTSTIVISLAAAYTYYSLVTRALEVLGDEADKILGDGLDKTLTEKERRQLEEAYNSNQQPIFIPFPGFTRTVEPVPYRGTDPEWQAYIQVNKDSRLLSAIRKSLSETVRRAIAKHPTLGSPNDKHIDVSKVWLDFYYPLKPPPTFVRRGLAIGGGIGIAWAERTVDSAAVSWTNHALWPSAVTWSCWKFWTTLVSQNATTIAKFFGYESRGDSLTNMQQAIEKIHQQFGKQQPGKPSSASPSLPPQVRTGEGSAASSLLPVDKRSTGTTTTPETMGTRAGMDNAFPAVPSAKETYMVRTVQGHTSGPWDQFKKSLVQKWRTPKAYPPRGSIRVAGLVEVITPRAIITVDCVAWWDPQTKEYDSRTLYLSVRAVRPKVQTPGR